MRGTLYSRVRAFVAVVAGVLAGSCGRAEPVPEEPTPVEPEPIVMPAPAEVHDRAAEFFATQPEYFRPLAHTAVPDGLDALDVEICGSCHEDQAAEWRLSTHARAWDDDQFQASLARDPAVRWICVNCHLPLFDQLEQLPIALEGGDLRRAVLVDNPGYDEILRDDAVGCAACHVRDGTVQGPTGVSEEAPHPIRKSPELSSPNFCIRCHSPDAPAEHRSLMCANGTAEEWRAWSATQEQAKSCVECHMPTLLHRLYVNTDPVEGRYHGFPGSTIPKRESDLRGVQVLQEIFKEGVEVELAFDPPAPASGSRAELVVTLHNANAGHSEPTGNPDRYLELLANVTGAGGVELASQRETLGVGMRSGSTRAGPNADNRLTAGERRTYRFPFQVPQTGGAHAVVELYKYRIRPAELARDGLDGVIVPGRLSVRVEADLPPADAHSSRLE